MFSSKNLKERWNGEMPDFWKRVQMFWIYITGVCGTIVLIPDKTINDLTSYLPDDVTHIIFKIIHYSLAIGIVNGIMLKLTKKDATIKPEPEEEKPER